MILKRFDDNISVVVEISQLVNILFRMVDDKMLPLNLLSMDHKMALLLNKIMINQRQPLRKTVLLFSNNPEISIANKNQGEEVCIPQTTLLQNST